MKKITRIRTFETKSRQVRCYGISKPITNRNEDFTREEPIELPSAAEAQTWRATLESCKVINRLLKLPGVTHLRFRPYEIHITLASVYDWSDIHDDVVRILKEEYFPGCETVVVDSPRKPATARIRTFATRSLHVRRFCLSTLTTNRNGEFTKDEPIAVPSAEEEPTWLATRQTCLVINRLLALPGITNLRFRPYEIHITLAAVFDWAELNDGIIAVLKDEYFKGNQDVVVESGCSLGDSEAA